ncbi:MAG: ankyrin repeat domain-containing protein [Actinomycetaceae bacterium]|nr:ankyrin repeat domain-containing protein [Actinomycetaceae bacterium]
MYNNVNTQDANGNTALMRAAIMAPGVSLGLVMALVNDGADINIQNNYGNTAIILAAMVNNHDTVSFLLDCGANVLLRNEDGLSVREVMNANSSEYMKVLNMLS